MAARPQSQLSIVLLPSGDEGEQVLDIARSWATEGLLKRGLWVRSDALERSRHGGASVQGLLLDHTQEQDLDVARVLASISASKLTMVVLQMVSVEKSVDPVLSQAAALLAETIQNARPESLLPDGDRDPVSFRVITLLASPTGTSGISHNQVAQTSYSQAVVAAPEDRRAADQMDQFVRPGVNYVPWATAQAATLAGLWAGMTQTPWDASPAGVDGSSSWAQGDFAMPMRSFARVVTSAPTARRALALAMDETRFAPGNLLADDRLVQLGEPEPVLAATLDAVDGIDNGRLRYDSPVPGVAPGQQRTPLLRALGEFTQFSVREIGGVPRYAAERSSARWSGRTTKVLSGEEGHQQITVRGQGSDMSVYQAQFERQATEAERQIQAVVPGVLPSAPELWRTLTQTTLALLDGSTFPASVPPPIVADRRVVLPSAMLAVPPPKGWTPDSEDSEVVRDLGLRELFVGPCSTRSADEVAALLAAKNGEQQHNVKDAQTRLMQAEIELASLDGEESKPEEAAEIETTGDDNGDPSEDDQLADGEEEVDAPAAEEPSTRSRVELRFAIASARMDLEAAERRLAGVNRLQDTFGEWLAQRENSLLWRLIKRVDERTSRAKEDSEAAKAEALEVPNLDAEEPRRARNQFANRFLLFLPVGLLLLFLTGRVLAPELERWLNLPEWLTWALVIAGLVTWLLIMLTSYYRRLSRFRRTVQILIFAQRDALRRFHVSIEAQHRLNGMYEQLIEWGEILGFAVHDPWQPEEQWFSGMMPAEFRATLPACVDLAVPDPDDEEGTRQLQRAASRSITGEGWRSATFAELHGLLLRFGGYDPSDGNAAAMLFDDSPAMPNGARKAMLDQLRAGAFQKQCARRVLEVKVAGLYAERETLMRHAVLPLNSEYAAEETSLLDEQSGLEKLKPSWGDYLTSALEGVTRFGVTLWSARGRTNNAARRSMVTLRYAPPGLHLDDRMPGVSIRPTAPADQNRGVEVVVRCDFGPAVEKDQLLLFVDEQLVESEVPTAPVSVPPRSTPDGDYVPDVKMFN